MPASVFFQFRKTMLPIFIDGGPENSLSRVIVPLSSAASPTMTLKVDPGGYAERKARGSNGRFGSSFNALKAAAEIVGTNAFGLNTGHDAIASTSPVFG